MAEVHYSDGSVIPQASGIFIEISHCSRSCNRKRTVIKRGSYIGSVWITDFPNLSVSVNGKLAD